MFCRKKQEQQNWLRHCQFPEPCRWLRFFLLPAVCLTGFTAFCEEPSSDPYREIEILLQQNDFAGAEAKLKTLEPDARQEYILALTVYRTGRTDEALELFQKAAQNDKASYEIRQNSFYAWFQIAEQKRDRNLKTACVEAAVKALSQTQTGIFFELQTAKELERNGQWQKALDIYTMMLSRQEPVLTAYSRLQTGLGKIRCLSALKDWRNAGLVCEQAIADDEFSTDWEESVTKEHVKVMLGTQDPHIDLEDARIKGYYTNSRYSIRGRHDMVLLVVSMYERAKETDLALQYLNEALALPELDQGTRFNLNMRKVQNLEQAERIKDAERLCERLYNQGGLNAGYRITALKKIAERRKKDGKYQEAIDLMKKSYQFSGINQWQKKDVGNWIANCKPPDPPPGKPTAEQKAAPDTPAVPAAKPQASPAPQQPRLVLPAQTPRRK